MYGSIEFEERRSHWKYIMKSIDIFNIPWMCIRDIIEVKENEEKDGGWMRSKKESTTFKILLMVVG